MSYFQTTIFFNYLFVSVAEADHIMQFEQELLALPCDLPTASEIDLSRLQTEELKKMHPALI